MLIKFITALAWVWLVGGSMLVLGFCSVYSVDKESKPERSETAAFLALCCFVSLLPALAWIISRFM